MRWTICTHDKYGIEVTVEYDEMPDFLRDTNVLRGFTRAVSGFVSGLSYGFWYGITS